jgi:DNA polymerase-3 subunit alpha
MTINFECGCCFPTQKNQELIAIDFDINTINFRCPKTWELIGDGNTKGCFQLESRLGQSMAKKLMPENIEQLSALISILRPGCLEAIRDGKSVSNHYIDKKNGQESIDYFHEALEPILKNTYGEMVYQEQAMEIAKDIAGFNLQEADMLRKAIGKKKPEEMAKIKTKFLEGSKQLGKVTQDEAEQIFGWIEKSQRYSFNKSHAVSYAINGYISAYAKAHFPRIFFLSYLRLAKDKIDPQQEILELISNARDMDISVFGPNLTLKNKEFEIVDGKIYFGLTNIKGLGDSVYTKLISIIEKFDLSKMSWIETLVRVMVNINSSAAKSLILSGAMDYLKISRNKMTFDLNLISELTQRELQKCIEIIDGQKIKDITILLRTLISTAKITKNRLPKILSIINQITNPPYSLDDDPEWISNNERDLLGASLTITKTDLYDSSYANTDCKDLKTFPNNKQFFVVAEIDQMSVIVTKRGKTPGKEMCFLRLSDSYGSLDSAVLFPEEFEEYKELLENGRVLMFSGQKSGKNSTPVIKKCFVV